MITIGANGEKITYGIKHYNLDTEEDFKNLKTDKEIMGTTCFVISTSKYYMLNSEQKWIQISPFGIATPGGGSGGNTPSNNVVYEGGVI